MNLNKLIDNIINEAVGVINATANKPIVKAIKNRNPISFFYNGPRKKKKDSVKPGRRIKAEVVAMGLSKKGNLIVRAWVEPPSVSKTGFEKGNWRTFIASRMGSIIIHDDETFENKRPGYKEGDDKSMTVTYVTSDWTKTKPVKKEPNKPAQPTKDLPKKATDATKAVKDTVASKQKEPKQIKKPEPPKEKEVEPTKTEPNQKIDTPVNKPEEPTKEKEDLVKKAEDATSSIKKSMELKQPNKKDKPLSLSDLGKEVTGDEDSENK